VAAHSNQLRDGKGRGIKAHDYRVAALCYSCHMNLDQGKSLDKAERVEIWEEAHRKTIAWLFENNHIEAR
jgi:Fe-S oxidoreductase